MISPQSRTHFSYLGLDLYFVLRGLASQYTHYTIYCILKFWNTIIYWKDLNTITYY